MIKIFYITFKTRFVMWLKQVTYQGRSWVHFDDAHNWGRYNKGVSPAISNDVSDVGTPEKMLKARTRNGTFWCNLNQSFWSWNCWDYFENKNVNWCIFNGISNNNVFGVGSAKKILKPRKLNGVFWLNLKRWFGSWNCKEYFEIKETKRCLLTLFKTFFWKLELLIKFWKQQG